MKSTTKELLDWIDKIKNSDKIIIVEGKEDKAALNKLDITNVIQLNKKPIYKIVEELIELCNSKNCKGLENSKNFQKKGKEVIILTDLDKKGKQLYGKLNHDLGRFGVKVDNKFRHFLFKHTTLRQIEGLDSYIERLNIKH